jgi:hypothetical protein
VPTAASIAHVTDAVPVLALNRDSTNTPGVPPLTDAGKRTLAWDAEGALPGSAHGNVNLNAHTWPDGTAPGNAMLRQLSAGDVVVLRGSGNQRQCYQVEEKLQVPAVDVPQVVLDRYYEVDGPSELTLLTCSGTRVRPGKWTHRTLWYATPFPIGRHLDVRGDH